MRRERVAPQVPARTSSVGDRGGGWEPREDEKGAKYFDLKEYWHVGREIPRDSKYADVMPPNLWPAEIPEFREVAYGLYEALDALPQSICHQDLFPRNAFLRVAGGAEQTVAIDWAFCGSAAIGEPSTYPTSRR